MSLRTDVLYSGMHLQFTSQVFITVYPLAPHIGGRALRGGPLDRSQVSVGLPPHFGASVSFPPPAFHFPDTVSPSSQVCHGRTRGGRHLGTAQRPRRAAAALHTCAGRDSWGTGGAPMVVVPVVGNAM